MGHRFTEFRDGPEYVVDAYNLNDEGHRDPKPVGNGTVTCEQCGLVLPTQDGTILSDWLQYGPGVDCEMRMVEGVHGR